MEEEFLQKLQFNLTKLQFSSFISVSKNWNSCIFWQNI